MNLENFFTLNQTFWDFMENEIRKELADSIPIYGCTSPNAPTKNDILGKSSKKNSKITFQAKSFFDAASPETEIEYKTSITFGAHTIKVYKNVNGKSILDCFTDTNNQPWLTVNHGEKTMEIVLK